MFLFPGCTTASLFILITGYATTPALAVAFLTIGVGITGLNASGYAVNILDIAPQYAGVIMGVTNVFGASPGFISPQIVGIVTPNKVKKKGRERNRTIAVIYGTFKSSCKKKACILLSFYLLLGFLFATAFKVAYVTAKVSLLLILSKQLWLKTTRKRAIQSCAVSNQ